MPNRISTVFVLGWVLLVLTACTGLPNESIESQTDVDELSLRNDSSQLADFLNLSKNSAGYVDIVPTQLAEVLGDEALTIVNVHIPDEGGLPETDLEIPFDTIEAFVEQLPDTDAPIVLYCRSGNMSTQTAETLVALGYTNIYELDGGFNAWRSDGYEFLPEDR